MQINFFLASGKVCEFPWIIKIVVKCMKVFQIPRCRLRVKRIEKNFYYKFSTLLSNFISTTKIHIF